IITVTCNNNGGQPVSMKNIKEVSKLAKKHNIPVVIDAARLAENAYFIKQRKEVYEDNTIKEITQEMFSYFETATMSTIKEGHVKIRHVLSIRTENNLEQAENLPIVHILFITYGGIARRDLEGLTVSL